MEEPVIYGFKAMVSFLKDCKRFPPFRAQALSIAARAAIDPLPVEGIGRDNRISVFALIAWCDRRHEQRRLNPFRVLCRIYFVQMGDGPIKIGITANVYRRIREIEHGSPYKCSLLAEVHGTRSTEKQIHDVFSDFRLRGEWFEPQPELLAFISAIRERQAENEEGSRRDAPVR